MKINEIIIISLNVSLTMMFSRGWDKNGIKILILINAITHPNNARNSLKKP